MSSYRPRLIGILCRILIHKESFPILFLNIVNQGKLIRNVVLCSIALQNKQVRLTMYSFVCHKDIRFVLRLIF